MAAEDAGRQRTAIVDGSGDAFYGAANDGTTHAGPEVKPRQPPLDGRDAVGATHHSVELLGGHGVGEEKSLSIRASH
jgi:hypothetical protein